MGGAATAAEPNMDEEEARIIELNLFGGYIGGERQNIGHDGGGQGANYEAGAFLGTAQVRHKIATSENDLVSGTHRGAGSSWTFFLNLGIC